MKFEIAGLEEVNESELTVVEGGHPGILLFFGAVWLGLEIGDRIWGMVRPGGSDNGSMAMERVRA